jgi:hypothetical protein
LKRKRPQGTELKIDKKNDKHKWMKRKENERKGHPYQYTRSLFFLPAFTNAALHSNVKNKKENKKSNWAR